MFKLLIAGDEGKTTVVPIVRDEVTIGRKEGNTIRLTERNVSRKHAKLRRANGVFFVSDLKSYNGVRVNGRRIEGEVASVLAEGSQLGVVVENLVIDGAPCNGGLWLRHQGGQVMGLRSRFGLAPVPMPGLY